MPETGAMDSALADFETWTLAKFKGTQEEYARSIVLKAEEVRKTAGRPVMAGSSLDQRINEAVDRASSKLPIHLQMLIAGLEMLREIDSIDEERRAWQQRLKQSAGSNINPLPRELGETETRPRSARVLRFPSPPPKSSDYG